ncbi:hypothetical protein [Halostagnicola sp. A-GB9-2]|uniref:hypothetical protein n=1 Tax=Halostagnicola sp. A-GB9-2 TaxID=3048066 RepID=UPI0024BF1A8E|nr:hypothetical protein [Halostagnicola sp. A-GB9-2]MDJ1431537.1 hypothetical protein [Halostagnicola sp. A-GB9-2]
MSNLLLSVLGPVVIGVVSLLVYWDARRVDVVWPPVWALLVFSTGMLGLGLFLFVPTVPIPGLLVIVLIGPVFYVFERDDTRHSDEPADPHTLADAETTHEGPDSITDASDDETDGTVTAPTEGDANQESTDSDEYADQR